MIESREYNIINNRIFVNIMITKQPAPLVSAWPEAVLNLAFYSEPICNRACSRAGKASTDRLESIFGPALASLSGTDLFLIQLTPGRSKRATDRLKPIIVAGEEYCMAAGEKYV